MSKNSQISDFSIIAFGIMILILLAFLIFTLIQKIRQRRSLIRTQGYYFGLCVACIIWMFSMIMMGFTPDDGQNLDAMRFWDALSNVGVDFSPVFMFFVTLSIVRGEKKLPKWMNLAFLVPILTSFMVFTNGLHHLVYVFHEGVEFSIVRKDFGLGPVLILKGVISYLYLISSVAILIWHSVQKKEKLVWKQSGVLMLGSLIPLLISILATAGLIDLSITATPLSFICPVVCHYIAIYRLNVLNIIPLATSKVLDFIPDGFMILDRFNQILDYNQAFKDVPGKILGMNKNDILNENFIAAHKQKGNVLYTLLSNMKMCSLANKRVSYEQTIYFDKPNSEAMSSYVFMVDILVVEVSNKYYGHIVIFRDITQLKRSMAKNQENQERLLEQERLAMLGQMMGGMAHNMKTPIMNIAGVTVNIETLMQEVTDSLGDPDVVDDDYREIVREVNEWLSKIRESCAYMSEIITAVKGQAGIATNTISRDFTVDEVIRCTELLMKHELKNNNTRFTVERKYDSLKMLYGDMNSLVQVLNNLISNAIQALKKQENREVLLSVTQKGNAIEFRVQDNGTGIDPQTQKKLFHEMVTTKGTKGTGLGLYISSTIIRGKFSGDMWYEDAPEGGAVLCLRIPLKNTAENEDSER